MELHIGDLEDYARGCAFLGTGGGGDPYVARLVLQQEFLNGKEVKIVEPNYLADDDLVVDVCKVGSPTVGIEKLMANGIAKSAVTRLQTLLGREVKALLPAEIGGNSAILPLIVGAQTGLPVVNGDGMGRAFPQFEMCTFSIYGCSASPAVLLNDDGDCVIIETDSNTKMEKMARQVAVSICGGSATVSSYPMSGKQVKDYIVPQTLTMSLEIGRTIREARESSQNPFVALSDYFGQRGDNTYFTELFDGKISDVKRGIERGYTIGTVSIIAMNGQSKIRTGKSMEVTFQNENLVAYVDGNLVAIVPDLIIVLDRETAEPITTESLTYGQRVKVVGLSCSHLLRTAEALEVVGPNAFSLSDDYRPIESLSRPWREPGEVT